MGQGQRGGDGALGLDDAAGGVLDGLADDVVGEVVVEGWRWPSISPTIASGTPPISASLANEWRRSWRRTSGMSSALRRVFQV